MAADVVDVEVFDVVDEVFVPPVEAAALHFGDSSFFFPVLYDDAVDGDDDAGAVYAVEAVDKDGFVFGVEHDLEKVDHELVLGLVGIEGQVDGSDLVAVIDFQHLFIKVADAQIDDRLNAFLGQLLKTGI